MSMGLNVGACETSLPTGGGGMLPYGVISARLIIFKTLASGKARGTARAIGFES